MERFYKPYLSDESESETDSDESGYISEESLLDIPGRNPPIPEKELVNPNRIRSNQEVTSSYNATKFETEESKNTTLFMINSRDRDTRVYPQPTFFTLRLPRLFRNVKQISITELSLLNSFFNFSSSKGNTWMYVYENGRTRIDTTTGSTITNIVKISIRDGTYNTDELVSELNNALNSTPLFADITLNDFINQFQSTGDYTLLFNTPGPTVYNSLTQKYDKNQTINNIVARYFLVTQTIGTVSYSYDECLVAYYYPVIKESIINSNGIPEFAVPSSSDPNFSWYDYIVFLFQGLSDPLILQIITLPGNQEYFNAFRADRTFNNFLVNKYVCTYNPLQGRLVINAPSLNDSIVNDLNSNYSYFLTEQVLASGLASNLASFNNQYNAIVNSNAALIEFYNFIQTRFATNFGVNFALYSDSFYSDSNNEIVLYNTNNRYGWELSLTQTISQSSISSNVTPEQIPHLWSNILMNTSTVSEKTFISTLVVPEFSTIGDKLTFSNASESHFGYFDIPFDVIPTTYKRIEFASRCRQNVSIMTIPRYANNRLSTNEISYNLSMESTPLLFYSTSTSDPLKPNYNILTDVSGSPLFNMYTIYQNMFESAEYMRNEDRWLTYMSTQIIAGSRIQPSNPNYQQSPPATDISLTGYRPFIFIQINADKYLIEETARFYISLYVEKNVNPNDPDYETQKYFPVPIVITWYKDRAGFMADVADDIGDKFAEENPRHFFKRQVYGTYNSNLGRTDISGARMDVLVNNDQITYAHIQLASTDNIPSAIPLRIYAILTNEYGVSTLVTSQLDRLDMPYDISTIRYNATTVSSYVGNVQDIMDPYKPTSTQFKDPTKSIYNSSILQLCYDTSNVSNNLLDYVIQAGNSNYYDPNNMDDFINNTTTGSRFLFNLSTNGAKSPPPNISSSQWSLFFSSGQNIIRDTYNTSNNIYLSSLQTPRQRISDNDHTITNWLDPFNIYIDEEYLNPNPPAASATYQSTFQFNGKSVFLTCSNTPTTQTDSIGSSNADVSGLNGIGFFLPPSEIVRMNSFLVKFAYIQPSSDDSNIQFTRFNPPLVYNTINTNNNYKNQTTFVKTSRSDTSDWDDWYLYNRRNLKLGIFKSCDIYGMSTSMISLSSALCTMTLEKVTQVANYKYQTGTQRTREPDWGTYYSYRYDTTPSTILWDVQNPLWNGLSTYWRSTIVTSDILTDRYSYTDEITVNSSTITSTIVTDYFETINTINNYSYLPRYFGIAPSVQYGINTSNTGDISNSYIAVPFYYDADTLKWKVGSFYGVSFTRKPSIPPYPLLGATPYYGPPGIYGYCTSSLTMQLYSNSYSTSTVYQPYFWNSKITFNSLDQTYDPATDLSLFGGINNIQNEFQDTMLFLYSNGDIRKKDIRDLSTLLSTDELNVTVWKWGMESNVNYIAYDDQSGYNFLSYIYNQPLRSHDQHNSTIKYAVHVRGYDPIPKFTTGIRLIGKNYTDFGQVSLWEIAQEIKSLGLYSPISEISSANYLYPSTPSIYTAHIGEYQSTLSTNNAYRYNPERGNYFSHEYADALINFNSTFSTNVTFGKKVGFNGFVSTFTGYEHAIKTYVDLYKNIRNSLSSYTYVLNTATSNVNSYVEQRYGNILPSSIINRNRITDPLPFQFLFSTMLTQPYKSMYDEWGLGYNLGFNKKDTYPPRTTVTSDTFIRIIQDYIYLRLNPELNLNVMSVSGKEDRAMCQDSTAQDDKYFAKILLNNFGGISRSAVVLPKEFNPVLGKYETISCQLVDKNGQQLNNIDCEYNFVLNINEITNKTKDGSSLQATTADLNILSMK
jgi:hypothetical protein